VWLAKSSKRNHKQEIQTIGNRIRNKCLWPLSSVQVQDQWRQSGRNKTMEERICEREEFRERWFEHRWWLLWGDTCMCRMTWTRRRVNRMIWRNEEGSWFHKKGDAYLKQQLVICNKEDTDGRPTVTTDDKWVLHVNWTEIRPCR